MQLNLVLAHQFIKKHAFFETSLHPVNRIGHNRYGFLLFLAKIYHLHKTLTLAAGSLSNIMHNASPVKQNKLLKLLIKDCRLHDKKLEYTVRAPFDKFIKCNNPAQWFKNPTQDLETYTDIADEVKMVKQQVL